MNIQNGEGGFWCHNCSTEITATLNIESSEYQCSNCEGSFIESLGQQLEEFLPNGSERSEPEYVSNNSQTNESNESLTEGSDNNREITADSPDNNNNNEPGRDLGSVIVQRLVNRILGIGVQTRPSVQSTLLTVLQQTALESGRPVAIVVRQAASQRDIAMLSSLLSPGSSEQNSQSDEIERLMGQDLANQLGQAAAGFGNSGNTLEDLLHHLMMTESSSTNFTPASERTIESLLREPVSYPEEEPRKLTVCSISQEPFEDGEVAVHLPCGHFFKESPIVQWLRRSNTCPVCRCVIPAAPEENTAENSQLIVNDYSDTGSGERPT